MARNSSGQVSSGGMWNTYKPEFSRATQDLLKVMMRESRLTNFQQRELSKTVQSGASLPPRCHPTSSARDKKPVSGRAAPRKPNIQYGGGLRTRDDCMKDGAYEREQFRPTPAKYVSSKEKKKLQDLMTYGEEMPEEFNCKPARPQRPPSPVVDRFDELVQEIDERQNFLGDMEAIGKGKQYRTIIATEISQLIREMETVDQQRTGVLTNAIENLHPNHSPDDDAAAS